MGGVFGFEGWEGFVGVVGVVVGNGTVDEVGLGGIVDRTSSSFGLGDDKVVEMGPVAGDGSGGAGMKLFAHQDDAEDSPASRT